MNREIKFRGKLIEHKDYFGEWVDGFYCQDLENGELCDYIFGVGFRCKVDTKTVGQFTGLKDKNGKYIYEGDIVNLNYTNKDEDLYPIKQIIFWNAKFVGYVQLKKISKYSECEIDEYLELWGNKEVIGNIHDNPELLTNK
jgi:uncharacterized phage protein (TIGR01671 family)